MVLLSSNSVQTEVPDHDDATLVVLAVLRASTLSMWQHL